MSKIIAANQVQALGAYLADKPYRESAPLIVMLQNLPDAPPPMPPAPVIAKEDGETPPKD